jgi:hypothetical protein
METEIEYCVIRLLREAGSASVPLRNLHGRLLAEAGPAVGSYARFAEELRRSQRLVVLESEPPLGDGALWPAGVRAEYEAQLAAAGIERGPFVALQLQDAHSPEDDLDDLRGVAPGAAAGPDAVLARLHHSLVEALDRVRDQSSMRQAITAALADCAELQLASRTGAPLSGDDP